MNFDGGRVKTVFVASLQVSFIATSGVRSSKMTICVKVWLFSNQKPACFLEISLNSSLIRLDQH